VEHKTQHRRKFYKALVWAGVAFVASAVILTVFAIRGGQQKTTGKVDYTQQAAQRILDCTDTKGKCATRNREAQAKLIKQLIDANAKNAAKAASGAAACANAGLTTYPSILACTLQKMSEK